MAQDIAALAATYRADGQEGGEHRYVGYHGRNAVRYYYHYSIYAPGFLLTGMVNPSYDSTNVYSQRYYRWREPIGLPLTWMRNTTPGMGRADGNMTHAWRRIEKVR